MLTESDFQRALDKTPEWRYVDYSWRIYDKYQLVEGEKETYVCAPFFLPTEIDGLEGTAYTANPVRTSGPEEEIWEALYDYFALKYHNERRSSPEGMMADFLVEFMRRISGVSDETKEGSLSTWLRRNYGDMDDTLIARLHKLHAESSEFSRESEEVTRTANQIYRDAIEAFDEGGTESMFECLRGSYEDVGTQYSQELEQIFESMREELGNGAAISEVLSTIVTIDESGLPIPGCFTRRVLIDMKQHEWKANENELRITLRKDIEDRRNREASFYPLSSPSLFLNFAELGEQGVTAEDVMAWVHKYGVLGLNLEGLSGDLYSAFSGGPQETVSAYAHEAKEANLLKRTYEAALLLDNSNDQDVADAIQEFRKIFGWSKHSTLSPTECREKALNVVRLQVQEYLDNHCSRNLHPAGDGFIDLLEFNTLLGAMYLQFAWMLREKADVRRCRRCNRLIAATLDDEVQNASTRRKQPYKNKEFCSTRCRDHYHNERKRKMKQESKMNISISRSVVEEFRALSGIRDIAEEELFKEMLRVYKQHDGGNHS